MKYIQQSVEANAVDEELKKLHTSVRRLKSSRKVGVKYMNMQEVMQYQIKKAVEANTEEVEQRMSSLTQYLLEQNRLEDLKRMTVDEAFRKQLLEEFHP